MVFINIKGYSGKFNCRVIGFYRENLEYLKDIIEKIYKERIDSDIPSYFWSINTIKELKEFTKTEMVPYMESYPCNFKHIDGIYSLYEAYF